MIHLKSRNKRRAGIVSLVPETRDTLDREGFQEIGIFAAGGICDGRGVAAALACGVEGVVMGTRFLASKEIELPTEELRDAILATKDGGVTTVRSTVFDELTGKNIWPANYDGRAIAGGFGGDARAAIWVGSGVGLVTKIRTAGEIVEEVRESAKLCLEKAAKACIG
ncbi:hypothetical protein G7Y89_g14186 [Cudoniella acicularis]|uniref:Nitronate monooxygenase domain-containing protein n=1 Tax=Cudoniella acicularis TaxID=354080 RepID=A0A8H4R5V0_9HELO|nr:hypothetical protein G7Y89_g14186 [Cudoniella acicularis]